MIKQSDKQKAFMDFKPNENTIKLASIRTPNESNLNEAMKCLDEITSPVIQANCYRGNGRSSQAIEYIKKVATIKQALLKAQEMEKILKIIKEKKVNILLLELTENVEEYNERIVPNGKLTEEEFDLLKRWVENE